MTWKGRAMYAPVTKSVPHPRHRFFPGPTSDESLAIRDLERDR